MRKVDEIQSGFECFVSPISVRFDVDGNWKWKQAHRKSHMLNPGFLTG